MAQIQYQWKFTDLLNDKKTKNAKNIVQNETYKISTKNYSIDEYTKKETTFRKKNMLK